MKGTAILSRTDRVSGKRIEKLEFFFYKNGVEIHRHSLIEDTVENRRLFPVRREFMGKLYTTQVLILCIDEIPKILNMLARKDAQPLMPNLIRSNWLTRMLWWITLKITFRYGKKDFSK